MSNSESNAAAVAKERRPNVIIRGSYIPDYLQEASLSHAREVKRADKELTRLREAVVNRWKQEGSDAVWVDSIIALIDAARVVGDPKTMRAVLDYLWMKFSAPRPRGQADSAALKITLSRWDGCDTYIGCSQCGNGELGEGPPVVLHRNRTELFAVGDDDYLLPVCLDCAQWHAPELFAEWWKLRKQEIDAEQAAPQRPKYQIIHPPQVIDDISF